MKRVEQFVVQDTNFIGQENSGTALKLVKATALIVNCTFVSNRRGSYRKCVLSSTHRCSDIDTAIDSLVVQLLQPTVQLISAKASINITVQTWVELYLQSSSMSGNVFGNNTATLSGGVLESLGSNITIEESGFCNNNATYIGGALLSTISTITIGGSNFTKSGSPTGAVIAAREGSEIRYHNNLLIANNSADSYGVIYLSDSEFSGQDSGNITFSNNLGSLVAFNSKITFIGYALFMNNQPAKTFARDFQEGGAISPFQSNVFFDGACSFEHNLAENGGAILRANSM